jgi:hypothetical protein
MLLLVALLSATGTQWLVLQSIAWSAMLLDYSRHAPLAEAVQQTFDGEHPCTLCKNIERGKKSEKKNAATVVANRLEFFLSSNSVLMFRGHSAWKQNPRDFLSDARFEQPPVPPPREALI